MSFNGVASKGLFNSFGRSPGLEDIFLLVDVEDIDFPFCLAFDSFLQWHCKDSMATASNSAIWSMKKNLLNESMILGSANLTLLIYGKNLKDKTSNIMP
jgi:hypothetical protein